jgi:MOSC domain-containing protein YiiM
MSNAPFEAKVLAIALKTSEGGPMREVRDAAAEVDSGLVGSTTPAPDRGVSFLAAAQWSQVNEELGTSLPWHTRRSNILLDADALGHLIGKTVRVGEVALRLTGETKPCALMDTFHEGLTKALVPDCRGGVHGRVLEAGSVRAGDTLTVID